MRETDLVDHARSRGRHVAPPSRDPHGDEAGESAENEVGSDDEETRRERCSLPRMGCVG